MDKNDLGIIGTGATSTYCLWHILKNAESLIKEFKSISIFEKGDSFGYGMPYNPKTTDTYNLANISSEEIPMLSQAFANWLRNQSKEKLKEFNILKFPIDDSEVYSRIALGAYFHEQYQIIITELQLLGFSVSIHINTEILNIECHQEKEIVLSSNSAQFTCSKVIIATGHSWKNNDEPASGYFASPWPIQKLLPKQNELYNHDVGILGASLSAFDVVTSLAHRHGTFKQHQGKLSFQLHAKAKKFKLILHAAKGWLPHLQYEQEEPFREIYRHTTRTHLLRLLDANGYLRIDTFFHNIGRPALIEAFKKDKNKALVTLLKDAEFNFKQFIETMSDNHEYVNSFEGMKKELIKAEDSIENKHPIHWMETLDDLMYCLNFHAELMPAEDHLFFKKEIRPFLMNVIAALPLSSAKILLALYDAGCIDLVAGKVKVLATENFQTTIEVKKADDTLIKEYYKLFINCSGNDHVTVENYPFQGLVDGHNIRKAKARFLDDDSLKSLNIDSKLLITEGQKTFLDLGGIDIDDTFRIIGEKNQAIESIYDLAFTHTYGCRPYSYGLQACNATSAIVVESWLS